MIRAFSLGDSVAEHKVGFEAQSPTGDGWTVTYDEIRFTEHRRIGRGPRRHRQLMSVGGLHLRRDPRLRRHTEEQWGGWLVALPTCILPLAQQTPRLWSTA
jgi:hypothetical protein